MDTLTEVDRWVGVIVAVVGTVVATPSGSWLLLWSSENWVRRQAGRARDAVAALLFSRGDGASHQVSAAAGVAWAEGAATVTSAGAAWHPDAPVDERIEALHQHVTEVESRLNALAIQVGQAGAELKADIERVDHAVNAGLAALNLRLDENEREVARVDARGLPVLLVGIILTAVPDDLAKIPWGLGWILPVFGIYVAAVAGIRVVQDRRRSRAVRAG